VSRTVYLGTSEFAAEVLRTLAASPHRPALVVTPPDRRRGRGRRVQSPPAADAARELGLELLQTANVNEEDAVARIEAAAPEVGAVCAFGQLIREPLLSAPPLLNVHPSLLPRWRGAAPIERAMIAGDATTGVSIMRLTEGLDAGPVALQEEVPIEPAEDFGGLSGRLAEIGGRLLVEALDRHAAGDLELHEQDEGGVTYAEKVEAEDRRLSPAATATELARRVRALNPHIGTYLETGEGERLSVRRAEAVDGGPGSGEIAAGEGRLLLGCADGALDLKVVQPPGGRPLEAADYLRGNDPPARAAE
jgi:methionyl-tRNA formyltransferase